MADVKVAGRSPEGILSALKTFSFEDAQGARIRIKGGLVEDSIIFFPVPFILQKEFEQKQGFQVMLFPLASRL